MRPRDTTFKIAVLKGEIVNCRACPRLVKYRESIAKTKKPQFISYHYWGKPVPGYGDAAASILIIGLAPAPHGGNRTGRIFTGDRSADFLVRALFESGFSNQPRSVDRDDGLKLNGVYMTAAVKCVPPDNTPTTGEMLSCSHFLESELEACDKLKVILCLGHFAYRSTMVLLSKRHLFPSKIPKFKHGLRVNLSDGRTVFCSYHPSPRNTQTGTLTAKMFTSLLRRVSERSN